MSGLGSAGRHEELAALVREHAKAVYALCHHVVGQTEAPDAAQTALEKIVTRIEQYDPEKGSFRTWALTVARNVCRDRLRRRGLERAAFAPPKEHEVEAKSRAIDPERAAIVRDDAKTLSRALTTLPEGMRSALVLFHVHGASYEEIATTLAIPKGTVMTWLHRGRKKLRQAMEAS